MGDQTLEVYPDPPLIDCDRGGEAGCRIVDPERYFDKIGHFATLGPGRTFVVDNDDEEQAPLYSDRRAAYRRNLRIEHRRDGLLFSDRISELGTFLSPLAKDDSPGGRLVGARRQALERILEIYGGPLTALDPETALERLRQVNDQLRSSEMRALDVEGNPGAVMELPSSMAPIFLGDLHGRVDNLLSVLCENAFLQAIESGSACLVLLGDVVHSDIEGQLEDMEGSVVLMDLVFSLMLAFPGRVTLLLGNHDSYSLDVMKSGVPQGLVWRKAILRSRGDTYAAELETFYGLCPLIALGEDFVACHAGPIRKRVSMDDLVNLRQSPELVRQLLWSRVRSPGVPAGYTKGDVKRFRKWLKLPKKTAFIVGHYVINDNQTIWKNVFGIEGHHILYGAEHEKVAIITRIAGVMVPQIYRCEPLTEWTAKNLDRDAAMRG